VADGVEDAGSAKRPPTTEKGCVEGADFGGDGAVEPADPGDGVRLHIT